MEDLGDVSLVGNAGILDYGTLLPIFLTFYGAQKSCVTFSSFAGGYRWRGDRPRTLGAKLRSSTIFQSAGQAWVGSGRLGTGARPALWTQRFEAPRSSKVRGKSPGRPQDQIRPMDDRTPHFFRSGQSAGQAPELAAAGITTFPKKTKRASGLTDALFYQARLPVTPGPGPSSLRPLS